MSEAAPHLAAIALLAVLAAPLGACSPPAVAIGAGAAAGLAVVDERSLGRQIDDAGLFVAVNSALLQKSEILFRQTSVEVVEARVFLTGAVPTAEDRVEATRLAWSVDGVREVVNELQVSDAASLADYARDNWIIAQMRARMLGDRQVWDVNYSVDSVNGVVYVMGIAQSEAELERVIGHARTIRGVQRVVSHVRLKSDPRRES